MSKLKITMKTVRYLDEADLPAYLQTLVLAGWPPVRINELEQEHLVVWDQPENQVITKVEIVEL